MKPIYKIAFAKISDFTTPGITPKICKNQVANLLLTKLLTQLNLKIDLTTEIITNHQGRKTLNHPKLDYNVSHSGDWLAVILSYSEIKQPVGVDLEIIKQREFHKILKYIKAQNEITQLEQILPNLTFEQQFYLIWCLREASLKASGVGTKKIQNIKIDFASQELISPFVPNGKLFCHTQLPFILVYFANTQASIFWMQNQNKLIPITNKHLITINAKNLPIT